MVVFTADGNGPAVTADKRAADFTGPGTVREPVITSLVAAQAAATKGDAAASPTVLGALGVDGSEQVTAMP